MGVGLVGGSELGGGGERGGNCGWYVQWIKKIPDKWVMQRYIDTMKNTIQ